MTDEYKSSESWSIETFARIRPSKKVVKDKVDYEIKGVNDRQSAIEIRIPDGMDSAILLSGDGTFNFNFNKIFDKDATQENVFNTVAKDKVRGIFEGINSTVFAYGQTGSGKTYSIFGGDSFQERGIIPRAINSVFNEVKARRKPNVSMKCHVSFTEVYKEVVYDLLDPQKRFIPMEQWQPVQIREGDDGLVMKNVNVFEVDSEEKALNIFFLGNTNRVTSSTSMNMASSRSHAIFTLIVESVEENLVPALDEQGNASSRMVSSKVFTYGKLNLVDLAGSERVYKSNNSKALISEAKSINLSLHYLEQVVISLRDKEKRGNSHVPYRNSLLTSVLRDSLGGNCRSCFLLTMALEKSYLEESISTCRFGQRCGEVCVQIESNRRVDSENDFAAIKIKNSSLTKQLKELQDRHTVTLQENMLLKAQLLEMKSKEPPVVKPYTEVGVPTRELTKREIDNIHGEMESLVTAIRNSMIDVEKNDQTHHSTTDITKVEQSLSDAADKCLNVFHSQLMDHDRTVLFEICLTLGDFVHNSQKIVELAAYQHRKRLNKHGHASHSESQSDERQYLQTLIAAEPSSTSNHTHRPSVRLSKSWSANNLLVLLDSDIIANEPVVEPISRGIAFDSEVDEDAVLEAKEAQDDAKNHNEAAPELGISVDILPEEAAPGAVSTSPMPASQGDDTDGQSRRPRTNPHSPTRPTNYNYGNALLTPYRQHLSAEQIKFLTHGVAWMKTGRMGSKNLKVFTVSPDLMTLEWRPWMSSIAASQQNESCSSIPLYTIENIELIGSAEEGRKGRRFSLFSAPNEMKTEDQVYSIAIKCKDQRVIQLEFSLVTPSCVISNSSIFGDLGNHLPSEVSKISKKNKYTICRVWVEALKLCVIEAVTNHLNQQLKTSFE